MDNYEEKKPEETSSEETAREALIITEDIRSYIYETAKWTNFLSIIGFILTALMVISAFTVGPIMSSLGSAMGPGGAMLSKLGGGFITVLYLFIALFYFYPSLLMYKYASAGKTAVLYGDQPSLSIAMGKMKSLFKFWGILTIIIIIFYILAIIFMVVAGFGAASMAG
ncbi:MAG TPA: DUF5362 family protein [Pedobacter sp.]|nr:DUF5362 family protein [Pedobacter sp.]